MLPFLLVEKDLNAGFSIRKQKQWSLDNDMTPYQKSKSSYLKFCHKIFRIGCTSTCGYSADAETTIIPWQTALNFFSFSKQNLTNQITRHPAFCKAWNSLQKFKHFASRKFQDKSIEHIANIQHFTRRNHWPASCQGYQVSTILASIRHWKIMILLLTTELELHATYPYWLKPLFIQILLILRNVGVY